MPRAPCSFKQNDVKRAVLAVRSAGVEVHGVEVMPDGRIRVMTINRTAQLLQSDDLDRELADFEASHGQD